MKHHLVILRLLFVGLALTALTFSPGLTRSEAEQISPIVSGRPVSAQDSEGKIVAKLKFDPKPNGFGFENYGNEHANWENDLNAGDLIELFGAENVCIEGDTPDNCVLYETAKEWMGNMLKEMNGGHCDGMAVVSLRFLQGKGFKGKTHAADFQEGAESPFDLKLTPAIANYIAHYFVTQLLDEVYNPAAETSKKKPSEILEMLISSMEDGSNPYTMSFFKTVNGEHKDGHAVTPYGVEKMSEDVYRVLLYDNNYPGQTHYLEINKTEETWKYRTATKPGEPVDEYLGNAETQSLKLVANSLRDEAPFACPFAAEAESHHAVRGKAARNQVEISLIGEGEMLITDGNGKRIGYDFDKNRAVNEIPGSRTIDFAGGLHKNVPPSYELPYQKAGKPYTIRVSGKGLKKEVDSDLAMVGPNFVVGFDGIMLDPGESLTVTISADGHQLSFTSSQDGQTPDIFLTTQAGPDKPSYKFEIGGIKLNPGKTVTVTLDTVKERLFFKDNDGKKDKYDVTVERTNADGTKNLYENKDFAMGKGDNYEMDFSKWTAKGGMCFKDDDEGNGFDDDDCVGEPKEAKPSVDINNLLPYQRSNSLRRASYFKRQ